MRKRIKKRKVFSKQMNFVGNRSVLWFVHIAFIQNSLLMFRSFAFYVLLSTGEGGITSTGIISNEITIARITSN